MVELFYFFSPPESNRGEIVAKLKSEFKIISKFIKIYFKKIFSSKNADTRLQIKKGKKKKRML